MLPSWSVCRRPLWCCIRNFEVIGEAAKNLPIALKSNYPKVPWDEMYGLRNRIAHEYFGMDYEIIWDIASIHLPENQKEIMEIIRIETGNLNIK